MRTNHLTLAGILLAGTAVAPALAADVTPERLLNAASEPQNWLMNHSTYDSHRYSRLDMINRDTVGGLKVAFTTAIGGFVGAGNNAEGGHQSNALAEDGMLYLVDAWGNVYAIDARSGNGGQISWIMDPGVDKAEVWIASNRGLSMIGNYIISVTATGDVNWTNKETGELMKTVRVDANAGLITPGTENNGYSLTTPPIAVGNKLIVGGSGGDRGARDHITTLNAETGEQLWRWYSIPAPGEPGSETWKDTNNAWMHGGGAFWVTGSYDPATNLTIWGTGQPVPMFDPEYRPGDNLYTDATVALDADTGELKWYFQYTPNDPFDYDEVGVALIIDGVVNGENRRVVGHFARNGFYYNLDINNGQFINATQYVDNVNWTDGIDPKTGKPVEYDPTKDIQEYKVRILRDLGDQLVCPHIQGGVNFFPTSFSPKANLVYGAGIEGCSNVRADVSRTGGAVVDGLPRWNGGVAAAADRIKGSIAAVNPFTGEKTAFHMFDYSSYSGVLSTGGGLVFTTTVDGTIHGLADDTLETVWEFKAGTLSSGVPMTYAVDGKQYVAVLMGGNRIVRGQLTKSPELADIQNTSMLYVFGL